MFMNSANKRVGIFFRIAAGVAPFVVAGIEFSKRIVRNNLAFTLIFDSKSYFVISS